MDDKKKSNFDLEEDDFFAEDKQDLATQYKYCQKCGTKAARKALVCSECGNRAFFATYEEYENSKSVKFCAACGEQNSKNAKFCNICGGQKFVDLYEDFQALKKEEALAEKKKEEEAKRKAAEKARLEEQAAIEKAEKEKKAKAEREKKEEQRREKENQAKIAEQKRADALRSSKEEAKAEIAAISRAGKWDVVTFGKFPQNGSEPEPIEWIVIKKTGGKALLMSKYALYGGIPFMAADNDIHKFKKITWEESPVRKWLNGEFLNNFTVGEREYFISTEHKNRYLDAYESEDKSLHSFIAPDMHYVYETPKPYAEWNDSPCSDKVFLLSYGTDPDYDADKLFKLFKRKHLKCNATPYAIQNGAEADRHSRCNWWTGTIRYYYYANVGIRNGEYDKRSRSMFFMRNVVAMANGKFGACDYKKGNSGNSTFKDIAIRPVTWVKLS